MEGIADIVLSYVAQLNQSSVALLVGGYCKFPFPKSTVVELSFAKSLASQSTIAFPMVSKRCLLFQSADSVTLASYKYMLPQSRVCMMPPLL